jgi:hypothetical protein
MMRERHEDIQRRTMVKREHCGFLSFLSFAVLYHDIGIHAHAGG